MVRYNLAFVDLWLKTRGAGLKISPHEGISLPVEGAIREQLALELDAEPVAVVLSNEERLQLLSFELLVADDYQTMSEIEDALTVSVSTISRDLPRLEGWLARHHLYLQRKPRRGLLVVGRESDRRHALVALLLSVIPEMTLLDLCMWGKKPKMRPAASQPAQVIISEKIIHWELVALWRLFLRLEEDLPFSLNDRDHLELILYLAFTLQRIRQGQLVELPDDQTLFLTQQAEYRIVETMAEQAAKLTGISMPRVELAQLILELMPGLRLPLVEKHLIQFSESDSVDMVNALVDAVRSEFDLKLVRPDVLSRMADHLSRTVFRLKYGMPIVNPLTDQVELSFPELWQATASAVQPLRANLGITLPREEIAFLTMYMGLAFDQVQPSVPPAKPRVIVACPTKGITVWMLVLRLQQEMPELEIVDVVSLRRLNGMKLDGVDAIISTAYFDFPGVPVIPVNPLVTPQDLMVIREVLAAV